MILCPLKSNKKVMEEFNELVELFDKDLAFFLWDKNNGYSLDRNPDGSLSERFSGVLSTEERHRLIKLIGNEIIQKSYNEDGGNLIDYVTDSEETVIKGQLGVDKSKLISLLGSTMYKANVLTTAVKELLQNAFDAVKIAKAQGKVDKPHITITLDAKERTVTVQDNGTGMSPEIVQKAFFTIGGSYKGDNIDNRLKSGGLGLAKMAFLFSSEYVEVSTVKDGIKTYAKTDPEEIQNDNFNIITSKTDEPSGTTVTVKIPTHYYTAEGDKKDISFTTQVGFLDKPMIGDVDLTIKKISKNWWGEGDYKTTEDTEYKGGIPEDYHYIGTASSDFGDVLIYILLSNSSSSYVPVDILISGLYQFHDDISLGWNGPKQRVRAIINILPSVGVTDPIYPINNQREGYRGTVLPEIEDLNYLLKKINSILEKKSISSAFNNAVSMDVKLVSEVSREKPKENLIEDVITQIRKLFSPPEQTTQSSGIIDVSDPNALKEIALVWKQIKESKEQDKIRNSSLNTSGINIDDSESQVDTSSLDLSKPVFHNNTTMKLGEDALQLLKQIGSLLLELKLLYILTYEGLAIKTRHGDNIVDYIKTQYWGFSFDKNYGGVNVHPRIFKFLSINPFYQIPEMHNVDMALALTEYITHLIIHEFNHNYASGEGAEFTGRFPMTYAEFAGIGKEFNKDWKNKLYSVIKNNIGVFIKYEAEYRSSNNLGESLSENRLRYSTEEKSTESQKGGIENDGQYIERIADKRDVYSYGEELEPIYDAIKSEIKTRLELESDVPFVFQIGEEKRSHRRLNLEKLKDFYANDDTTIEYCQSALKWAKGVSKGVTRAFKDNNNQDDESYKILKAKEYLEELKHKWSITKYRELFNEPYMFRNNNGTYIVTIRPKVESEILTFFLNLLDELSDDLIYSEVLRIELENPLEFMYYINPRKYPNIREQLRRKITWFNDLDIDASIGFLHNLERNQENNVYVDCCLKWLKNGTILLPVDNEIVRKSFDFARLHRIDVLLCKSPLEIYRKYILSKQVNLETRKLNMSNYDKLTFNRSELTTDGVKVDIYDVEDSLEGQSQICLLLADSNPKEKNNRPLDFSPWCLSTFNVDANGKATPTLSAINYWHGYDTKNKQIAIVDGKPVAFNADHEENYIINTFHGFRAEHMINTEHELPFYLLDLGWRLLPPERKSALDKLIILRKIYNIYEGDSSMHPTYSINKEFVDEIISTRLDRWWDYHDAEPVSSISDIDISYAEESLKRKCSYDGMLAINFGAYLVTVDQTYGNVGLYCYRDDDLCIIKNVSLVGTTIDIGTNVRMKIYQEENFFDFLLASRPFGFGINKRVRAYEEIVIRLNEFLKDRSRFANDISYFASMGISRELLDKAKTLLSKSSVYMNDIKEQIPFNLSRVCPTVNELLSEITSILKIAEDHIKLTIQPLQNVLNRRPTRSEVFDPEGELSDEDNLPESYWRNVAEANMNAWLQDQGLGYGIDALDLPIEAPVTSFIMRDYMWDRYNELIETPMNKELSSILHDILKKFHFDIIEQDLTNIFGENVLGAFDYIQKIIYLAEEGDRNAITDAEEFSHAFIKMMGARYRRQENRSRFPENKLYNELLDLLDGTYFYANVYDQYKDVYKYSNGQPNISKIKEEALGKALAVALNDAMDRYKDEKSKTFFQKLNTWFNKAIKWIKDIITRKGKLPEALTDLNAELNKIADSILDGTYFKKYLKKINDKEYRRVGYLESMKYAQLIGRQSIIDLMKDMSDLGGIVSGSISYRLLGILKRPRLDTLHDIDIAFPLSAHGLHRRHPENGSVFPSMYYAGADNVWLGLTLMNEIEDNPQTHRILEELRKRKGFDTICAFMADGNVILNCIICEDKSIVDRFKSMDGNFNSRLKNFTKKEQDLITLIDIFFNGADDVSSDYIRDEERGINLANYRHSFTAKLKFGRAKDIYDYQQFEPEHRYYKSSIDDNTTGRSGLTTEDFLYQLSNHQRTRSELSERIAGQFNKLYKKYQKMPNKSAQRQKILDKVFEKFNELQQAEDYEAVTIALKFAVLSIGLWEDVQNNPLGRNNVICYLYNQKNKPEPYSDITPLILIDMYKNSISFYEDLISHFIPTQTDPNLTTEDRNYIKDVNDSISIAKRMWLEALVVVGDKIVDKNIDTWVHATPEDKEGMKIVAKDYLHSNMMYGDTWSGYATFLNNSFSNSPIIKQAFHLILIAQTKRLEELLPISTKVMKAFRKADTKMRKIKNLGYNWQSVLLEKDRNGVPTGLFTLRINYGQYKLDLANFLNALNDEFERNFDHFYIEDEYGMITNSLTGERADQEEWGPNGELPLFVKYQLAIDKWKCEHSHRRYTYEYYKERLSKPYKGSVDPNDVDVNHTGHGLSPRTLFIYDHILSNINYYLDKCTDVKTGLSYPEKLNSEEKAALDMWQDRLLDILNPYNEDLSPKSDNDRKIAFEIRAWLKWIGSRIYTTIDLEAYNEALDDARDRALRENDPNIYYDFVKYNSQVGINPEYLNYVFGGNVSNRDKGAIVTHAEHIKRALQSLVKSNNGTYTRNLDGYVNNPDFWSNCRKVDQIIEDGRDLIDDEENSTGVPIEFDDYFEYESILYRDAYGRAVDQFGHPVDISAESSHDDLLTYLQWIINYYTNLILSSTDRTFPGINDNSGNPYVFTGSTEDVRRKVGLFFTYTKRYTDEDGNIVVQRVPLSIFSMLKPTMDSFINPRTGNTEPTILNVPKGRFSEKMDPSDMYLNSQYNIKDLNSELPFVSLYKNLDWDKIEKDPQLKALYDELINAMQYALNAYTAQNRRFNYALPAIEANTMQLLSRIRKLGVNHAYRAIKDQLSVVRQNDQEMRLKHQFIRDFDGSIADDVPLKYVGILKDPSLYTTDVVGSVIEFVDMALGYKYKSEIDPQLKTLLYNMDDSFREQMRSSENPDYDYVANPQYTRQMKSMLNMHMYNNLWAEDPSEAPNSAKEVFMNKAVRRLQSMERLHMLNFNLFSMVTGGGDATSRMIKEAINSKYFTLEDIIRSTLSCIRYTPQVIANWGNPLSNNKLTSAMHLNGISKDTHAVYEYTNRGWFRKLLSNIAMQGFSLIDWMVNALLLRCTYNNYRLYDGGVIPTGFYSLYELQREFVNAGKSKYAAIKAHLFSKTTLWHAYDKNMQLKPEFSQEFITDENGNKIPNPDFICYVSENTKTEVRSRAFTRGGLTNGMNPDNDKPASKMSKAGNAITALRSWMFQCYQHLIIGREENIPKLYKEETTYDTKRKHGKTIRVKRSGELPMSQEDRNRRMSWNYETGTPQDAIYKNICRSFNTLYRKLIKGCLLRNSDGLKAKLSYPEKYAWRSAIVYLAILGAQMVAWPTLNDMARQVPAPKNRKEAGPVSVSDVPRWFKLEYIGKELWKLLASDVGFRIIEALITSIDPSSAAETVKLITTLYSGVDEHLLSIKAVGDMTGFSGHELSEEIKTNSSYRYYTRGERVGYKMVGSLDNLHTAFTYNGIRYNQQFYTNTYGGIYRWFGYDFSWSKDKKKKDPFGLNLDLDLDLNLDLDLDLDL